MTRNEDSGSAERYLHDSGSGNRNVEIKCCYLDVILVGVSLILKLGISWCLLNESVKVLGVGD